MTLSVAVRKVGSSHSASPPAAPAGEANDAGVHRAPTETSAWTPSRCGSGGVSKSPVALSHSRTWVPSRVTTSRPSGANVVRETKLGCRMGGGRACPSRRPKPSPRVSVAALTRRALSGLKARGSPTSQTAGTGRHRKTPARIDLVDPCFLEARGRGSGRPGDVLFRT